MRLDNRRLNNDTHRVGERSLPPTSRPPRLLRQIAGGRRTLGAIAGWSALTWTLALLGWQGAALLAAVGALLHASAVAFAGPTRRPLCRVCRRPVGIGALGCHDACR